MAVRSGNGAELLCSMTDNAYRRDALPLAVLGVSFDNLTVKEAIERIEQMISSGRAHYAATANVDFLVQAQSDVELHRILLDADLVFCDGTPLVWASRFLGNPLPQRVAGADLVPELIRKAAEKNYRLFFLGAAEATANCAAEKIRSAYPNLWFEFYAPPFGSVLEMDHDEIRRRISRAKPDLLFVAFGCPKQEKWIAMHYQSLGVPVSIGVGGTIDFLAGQRKRAPVWMQQTGTEWIFRLAQEPRRLVKRYARDLQVFLWKIFAQWRHLKPRARRLPPEIISFVTPPGKDIAVSKLPRQWDIRAVRESRPCLQQFLSTTAHCVLEASDVEFIDSTGIGLLIKLHNKLRASNRQLILLAPSRAIERALRLVHLEFFFFTAADFHHAKELLEMRTREVAAIAATEFPGDGMRLRWAGEITAANAKLVWSDTEAYLLRATRDLEVDLSGVRFMDSSGLGVMVKLKKQARKSGKELSFVNLPAVVHNVVHVSRLDEFLLKPAAATPNPPRPLVPARLAAS